MEGYWERKENRSVQLIYGNVYSEFKGRKRKAVPLIALCDTTSSAVRSEANRFAYSLYVKIAYVWGKADESCAHPNWKLEGFTSRSY